MLLYQNFAAFLTDQTSLLDRWRFSGIPDRGIVLQVLSPSAKQDKRVDVVNYSVTHRVECIEVDHIGIVGDRHRKQTRPATTREKSIYPKGTEIRQHRHMLAVSPYDCKILSERVGAEITPELLGVNLVIGREDGKDYSLCALPINAHLLFYNQLEDIVKPSVASMRNYTLQQGCKITGNAIAQTYRNPALTNRFVEASKDNRGIVLSVEHPVTTPAKIQAGQRVMFAFPTGITP